VGTYIQRVFDNGAQDKDRGKRGIFRYCRYLGYGSLRDDCPDVDSFNLHVYSVIVLLTKLFLILFILCLHEWPTYNNCPPGKKPIRFLRLAS
jgi:hypothetical protein